MSAEEATDKLKLFWEHFFKAETGTYEKSTWLDLFLAEFLIQLREGADPKDLINFCSVSGVVSLVGCELLCGIHRVTSSIHAHCSVPMTCTEPTFTNTQPNHADDQNDEEGATKPEDTKPALTSLFSRNNEETSADILRKYLLSGVAWKCLALLRALGVQGLSCCRQLSSVLLWVWGELRGGGSTKRIQRSIPATPIHQLFSSRIWTKQKTTGSPLSKGYATSSEKSYASTRTKRLSVARAEAAEKSRRKLVKPNDVSSESGESNDDLHILNRSLTIKVCTPDDFEYFESPVRNPNEVPSDSFFSDRFYTPRATKPKAADYMTDKHKEIINSDVTAYEFMLLVTDLLQDLCKTESSLSGSEGSLISMQCINFSLRTLCSIQFGSLSAQTEHYDEEETSIIKVALTELLIVSLDKVLVHSDLCAKLINNGILPMLLRLLEDVICKSTAKYNSKVEDQSRAKHSDKPSDIESENLLRFTFGIAYSITAFFHCLLMQCRTVDKLREFTEQFKLYGDCHKGGLLKECVELLIRISDVDFEEKITLIKKLIDSIGKLISGMKRVRSEVIHSAACPRSRHKTCRQRVTAGMHHHHDILGEASSRMPITSACCISVLYATLTSLVVDEEITAQTALKTKILKVLLNCGVCCCFSPGFLMESIVRLMLTHSNVAPLCLQVLEHTVYGELGASVLVPKPLTDQLPCSICEPCDEKREFGRKFCTHGLNPVENKTVWSFLIHYNSLLQLDNHNNVLHATVSHLLRVTPKCRTEMKYELLFSVIYPTFIVAKHRYMIRMEESAYFLTAACLNIFASLLNTITFAEQFIQKGGLSYVLELVSLSEFSNQCCAILEIAIIVEIYKMMKENSELAYYREMGSLLSVQMFLKCLTEVTDKCLKIYKMKFPVDTFEEVCDVSKEVEKLSSSLAGRGSGYVPTRKISVPIVIKSGFAQSENVLEDSVEDFLEVLKNISVFWKSCAGLCLYSPTFRDYLLGEAVFMDSFSITKMLLYYLSHCEYSPNEMRLLMKIIEALLTTQLAVSDVTSGLSKEACCNIVRDALQDPMVLLKAGDSVEGGCLRALCDALMRVACAEPSRTNVMPKMPPPKVPPLVCDEGVSSAECSSSEDSVPPPYASEHSEHTKPDHGYDADVELGKLDISAVFKDRKLSSSHSTSTINSDLSNQQPVQWRQYNGRGKMAAPELCDVLLNVLVSLMQHISSHGEDSAAMAQVVRVCGALARAGAAHAPLLRRLLLLPPTQLPQLHRPILDLIETLASSAISSTELTLFFRLFLADAPPVGALLSVLRSLVDKLESHAPAIALSFPIEQSTDGVEVATEATSSSQSPQAEAYARQMYLAHTRSGLVSSWRVAAVRVAVEGAGWAPWIQGFTVVAWLRLPEISEPEWNDSSSDQENDRQSPRKENVPAEPVHILSVGNDSLLFEVWLDPGTGWLEFRATREGAVLSAARGGPVPRGAWGSLALSVASKLCRRRVTLLPAASHAGAPLPVPPLPLPGILVRKVTPTNLLLGHALPAPGGAAYALGEVRLFRQAQLAPAQALHLASHGPHAPCHIRCEYPNIGSVMTPELVNADIDWDQVAEMPGSLLRELHENLLLTYSAHAPNIVNLYHQTLAPAAGSLPGVFGGRLAGAGGAGGAGGAARAACETVAVWWAGAATTHPRQDLAAAALPGADALLYLFARVVELESSAEDQAHALYILLKACHTDDDLYVSFYKDDCLAMIDTVLSSSKCEISEFMIKAVLDVACRRSPLQRAAGGVLLSGAGALVTQPALLPLLLPRAKRMENKEVSWEVETAGGRAARRGSLWSLYLQCLLLLVAELPRRAAPPLTAQLLHCCKERFLLSDAGPLREDESTILLQLLRALMGSPPPLENVTMLADLLLLLHQASDTFVTHSRANYYFLLSPETQEMSDFGSLPLTEHEIPKKSSRKSKRRIEDHRPSISSYSTEDVSNENSFNGNKEKTVSRDFDGDKTDHESSVESTKLMKGIINMQIKERRKHKTSSTSENSYDNEQSDSREDKQMEKSEKLEENETQLNGNSNGTDDDLQEYIVVEPTDVTHTTVHMYTSGIYHQQRVKAGASDGWAVCEGLLMLLRDIIAVMPEQQLAQALAGPLQVDAVLVLGNHRSARVRAGVLRVLAALQRPCPQPQLPQLLAHQISLYEGSWELAAACAEFVTKCDVPLEDQLHEDIWADATAAAAGRAAPLLALLACCAHDAALLRQLCRLSSRVAQAASLKALHDICFNEAVVRAIKTVGSLPDEAEGKQQMLEDLNELLNSVAVKALAAQNGMQMISDIHNMLTFVEVMNRNRDIGAAEAAKQAQVSLFIAQLDYLEERLHSSYTASAKYSNYFSTVLSSSAEGAARGELAARQLGTLQRGAGFVLARSPRTAGAALAPLLPRLLLPLLLAADSSGGRMKWWAWGSEAAAPAMELVWWAGACACAAVTARLLCLLHRAPRAHAHARKLAVYLLVMVQRMHSLAEAGQPLVELPVTDWARGLAVSTQADLAERINVDSLADEAEAYLAEDEVRWTKMYDNSRISASIAKTVFSREALAAKITESAMSITRKVVEQQNCERKSFMEQLRRVHSSVVAAAQRWQKLIDRTTHQHAMWHDARRYPRSWQLDPTEAPGRVRRRLRRHHLHVAPRFLQPAMRHKAELAQLGAPLSSVVGGAATGGGVLATLRLHERVSRHSRARLVTCCTPRTGDLLLTARSLHFVPDDNPEEEHQFGVGKKAEPVINCDDATAQIWPLDSITQVVTRRWCLQEVGIELFLNSGRAYLLAFEDVAERTAFLKALSACHLPNKTEPETLQEAMAQWRAGAITNWDYLMTLNGLAGRSYNDLMQYPVFPFVLADYTSRTLDLTDPAAFRDLSRPMAVQNKAREAHYIKTYNDLKAARREGCSPLLSRQPHHYASLYSNSGGVLHYLLRVPPYTQLLLQYQDNNFDMPDRTFHSLATTWRLITQDSPTDVKELIPELFYLPEMFYNKEGLELGVRQCGARVDSVELPPWAPDARLFTLLHRQALEAAPVADALAGWLDLVFGCKQTGAPAQQAINVFPACTYYGFDPSSLEDEVDRTAAAAMVRTYGQAPRQLLRTPHPRPIATPLPAPEPTEFGTWGGVSGVRWGSYCGSPARGAVLVVRRSAHAHAVVAAPHARHAAAVPPRSLLTMLTDEGGTQTEGAGAALVWWGAGDGALRLQRRRPQLLLQPPPATTITSSASLLSARRPTPFFLGLSSGQVLAVRLRSRGGAVTARARALVAHRAAVVSVHACAAAALLATASADGRVVLWDLNTLSYIRTLPNRGRLPARLVTVSPTLADVAAVHELAPPRAADDGLDDADLDHDRADGVDAYEADTANYKSLLRVYTCNGSFVGSVKVVEQVTAVCYSNAPEGVSVNAVVCGLASGAVRLYCSWTLSPLASLAPQPAAPIASLCYSTDASVLWAALADGTVLAWEAGGGAAAGAGGGGGAARAPPRLLPAAALL